MGTTVYQGVTPAPSNVTAVEATSAQGTDFYGSVIPEGYGTRKVEGAVIWVSPVSTVTAGTTTDNVVDFAVSFGARSAMAGIKTSVRRLYFNDAIVMDKMGDTPVRAKGLYYTLYNGSETQTFDPTIEKWQGKGNTPAYRGQIYAVIRNFSFSAFGVTDVPSVQAVLSDMAIDTARALEYQPMENAPYPDMDVAQAAPFLGTVDWANGLVISTGPVGDINDVLRIFDAYTMEEILQIPVKDKNTGKPKLAFIKWPDHQEQPTYSGAPLNVGMLDYASGPFILPETGYLLICVDSGPGFHPNSGRWAIVDPITGRVLGKTAAMAAAQYFAAVEHVALAPTNTLNMALPGA